ncbi:MAG: hypothetical protein QF363_18330 [Planctomycetaceae bacterium]|jgi:hypothetical protein|nr:hypothetical protein [Planctomycetaceae bacterium]
MSRPPAEIDSEIMSNKLDPRPDPAASNPMAAESSASIPEKSSGTRASGSENTMVRWTLLGLVILATAGVGLAIQMKFTPAGRYGDGGQVTTAGSVEVTATLVELPGEFLPNDGLYNYAFVLKYKVDLVHRGETTGDTIYVAHYNPRKPRGKVADEFYADLGGTVTRFRAGDAQRMALTLPLDEHYIGAIVDRYHKIDDKTVYWAIWTNATGSGW